MSLLTIVMWTTLGTLLGVAIVFGSAGSQFLREPLLRRILRSNRDGWVLTQEGNRYSLEPLTPAEDADAFIVGDGADEEDSEWIEDHADRMHSLEGVPLGLRLGNTRQVVDATTAEAAEVAAEKSTDGGLLDTRGDDEEPTVHIDDLRDSLYVGHVSEQINDNLVRSIHYLNPFYKRAESPDIVDLRRVAQWFRHDADPDAPKKAAKNAVEAERSFESFGELKEFGKVLAAFIAGAVAAFIGSSGGGGGVNLPMLIDVAGVLL